MRQKSQEDYLRAIYTLWEREKKNPSGVKSVAIAKFLKISKSSVSQMTKKLADKKLIKLNPYSNISLTNKGHRIARQATHNYRVIEVFLKKILDYKSLDKLEQEAHKLEHAFSEISIKKLDKFLGNPKICPHGYIIHK